MYGGRTYLGMVRVSVAPLPKPVFFETLPANGQRKLKE